MKTNFLFFLFFTFLYEINSICNYSDNFPFYPPKKINFTSITKQRKFKISYDYSTIQSQLNDEIISKPYYNTIKYLLEKSKKIFSFLFTNQKYKIKLEDNICGEKITKINKNEIETDILIIPYFDLEENDIQSGLCVIDSLTSRPLISILKIPINIKFQEYNSYNKFMINLSHQLIHILAFNKNGFEKLGKKKY